MTSGILGNANVSGVSYLTHCLHINLPIMLNGLRVNCEHGLPRWCPPEFPRAETR